MAEKKGIAWRPWLRAIHRDAGYLAVGLTLIYAASGLAVNHIADWDPNFRNYDRTHEIGPVDGEPEAVAAAAAAKLGISETPRDVFAEGDEVTVTYEHRSLHVAKSGHVLEEGQKPRFLLRVANWLHLNRGKKAWRYVADTYAAALLFLAVSGMFMIKGRQGLIGRGAVLVAVGVAIPIVYVTLAGGP